MQNLKGKVLGAESGENAALKRLVEEKEAAKEEVEWSNVWGGI